MADESLMITANGGSFSLRKNHRTGLLNSSGARQLSLIRFAKTSPK
ncbi:MAG TPA: hypothetical protein VFD58_26960 [Blastocatellia bacterium]|nr:hypothetical protein [Blastocatellia bacterium]